MSETHYKYVTKGSNWAWGRNTAEQTAWSWIRLAAVIGAIFGIALGAFLGVLLTSALTLTGAWLIVVPVILALLLGIGITVGIVILVYKISEWALEFYKTKQSGDK